MLEDDAGARHELARPGKVFGKLAAVAGEPRTATIVATCPTHSSGIPVTFVPQGG